MIDYHQALQQILALARPGPEETCRASAALGRVLAAAVTSGEDLPPFDNSAMDGFALRSAGQALAAGREFTVRGALMAGDGLAASLQGADQAWEIMTGARLPQGADTVVPVEQVAILERDAAGHTTRMRLAVGIEAGRHVRRAGEDVARGATILTEGTVLQAPHLAMLAALGIASVPVRRRPRVALVCTGRELVDDPDAPLRAGQIRNSNAPLLAARIVAAGAELVLNQTVDDAPQAFAAVFETARAAGVDVFISTGAVSMGHLDFVPETLARAGAQLHFHKVRIRPGKPLLFASLPASSGGMLCFGLPGNPASGAVGMRFFVEPALRAMLGMAPETPLRAVLETRHESSPGWRFFLKGRLALDGDGRLRAGILPGQESFRIRPLLDANAWVVIPAEAGVTEAGSLVEAWPPGHLSGLHVEVTE